MGPGGHLKVPQIGRVIIQDDVEIGANSCVDRGALKDTVIGEGTKIDNLVQIGHNVVIGRHCVIVGQVGISGSAELGDFVVMGGQSGAVGHIKIGTGAQIAGASHPKDDVAPGARMGGTPAVPLTEWARQLALPQALNAKGRALRRRLARRWYDRRGRENELRSGKAMTESGSAKKLGTADITRVLKLLPHRYPFLHGRPHHRHGRRRERRRHQERHHQRAVLPGPLSRTSRSCPACSSSRAWRRRPARCASATSTRPTSRSSSISWGSTAPSSASRCCRATSCTIMCSKIRSRGRAWRFYGEAKVNGQVVAEAEVSAMILDPDDAKM